MRLWAGLLDQLSAIEVLAVCHPEKHAHLNARGQRIIDYLRRRRRR